jgi:S-adenosylmethionine synthetase
MKHEVIERKGIGHPDTIADNLGEKLGEFLKRSYIAEYGKVMHYNVDKVLVGSGKIDYTHEKMTKPVNIVFAGQYTILKKSDILKLMELAVDEVLAVEISNGLKYKIYNMLTDGSPDLADNFLHRKCNDTSFGVGNPYTPAEKLVLNLGKYLDNIHKKFGWAGTDNKIMYIDGDITIAFAFKRCHDSDAYFGMKKYLQDMIYNKFHKEVAINCADTRSMYFNTITGTSLEQGDAGMTGRGNRFSGLITPLRYTTLEAYYGKNDVTHIGRIYQKMAQQKAQKLKKSVLLVNKIGANINKPIVITQ